MQANLKPILGYFLRPLDIFKNYTLLNLRFDLVAGLTVTVILLPQAIAYALVAELPVEMGLYSAIVATIVGALWGSSHQLQTGPTNTSSLLVLSVLLSVTIPGTPEFMAAAGLMAVMVGFLRLVVGVMRLGLLVNFVSDSVVVGFSAGTGILIAVNQMPYVLGIEIPKSSRVFQTIIDIVLWLPTLHWLTFIIGGGTILFMFLQGRFAPKLPGPLLSVVLASVLVWAFNLPQLGLDVVGELPRGLPPLTSLPLFDLELIGKMSTGSLAIAAIGLVEAASISRSIASKTGQRLDSNQEFVGQGLASIACGFFSGYTCSGSFARSAANYSSGGANGCG